MLKYLVAAIAAVFPSLVLAQTGVDGRIISGPSGNPIANVHVSVIDARVAAISDERGRFTLQLSAGQHRIVARRIGFRADTVNVAVTQGARTSIEIRLVEAATIMAPTVVTGTRELQRREEGSVTVDVLDGAEVRRTRAISGLLIGFK
jgi:hypothetical protein